MSCQGTARLLASARGPVWLPDSRSLWWRWRWHGMAFLWRRYGVALLCGGTDWGGSGAAVVLPSAWGLGAVHWVRYSTYGGMGVGGEAWGGGRGIGWEHVGRRRLDLSCST
jgi:hypothetical protein